MPTKSNNSDMTSDLTPTQQLLIKACLASSETEQQRWVSEWEEKVVINDLEYTSSRLIPYFLHQNQRAGITTRHDKRLKIIYKHWWLRTQHINDQLNKVLAALTTANIGYIVIKGATTRSYYEPYELRTMADFDILVRPEDLQKVLSLLGETGYIPNRQAKARLQHAPRLMMDFMHAIECAHQLLDTRVDVHWRVGSYSSAAFTKKLWAHVDPYELFPGAQKPRLPYEVFIILLHASMNGSRDNLNWIIDMSILNTISGKSFWEEVRQLFIDEKKEDMFDYACSVLLEYGVYAPSPAKPVAPPVLTLITDQDRQKMSLLTLLRTKLANFHFKISQVYPHAGPAVRLYQYIRRIRFYFVLERFPDVRDEIPKAAS